MSIISLITDFGHKDNFVGVMKAVILNINPRAEIVDICNEIRPQGILEAAFLLKGSFKYFTRETIHLVVVDPGVGSKRKKILVKTKNYLFIGPDNGILSLALKDEPPVKIFEITNDEYFLKLISNTFHGRDIFAPVAAHLSKGAAPERFGRTIKSFVTLNLPKVRASGNKLTGEIIYVDRFGNLISNIERRWFERFIKGRRYKICIGDEKISRLSKGYFEGSDLKPIALIDSFGYLEVALNSGSARKHLGLDLGARVNVCILHAK